MIKILSMTLFGPWTCNTCSAPVAANEPHGRDQGCETPYPCEIQAITVSMHPDTERLDWLATNREKINNIESHAGGGWTIWWEQTPSSDPEAIAYGRDLRTVIDDAARKEAREKP